MKVIHVARLAVLAFLALAAQTGCYGEDSHDEPYEVPLRARQADIERVSFCREFLVASRFGGSTLKEHFAWTRV